jgi:hypothetical protein
MFAATLNIVISRVWLECWHEAASISSNCEGVKRIPCMACT